MRAAFRLHRPYPARLLSVETRPLENRALVLLRLEFEIFEEGPSGLRSLEEIASRDIVVGRTLNLPDDAGIVRYFRALRLRGRMDSPDAWKAALKLRPWVSIEFGPVEKADQRNSFASIVPYDAAGMPVLAASVDLKKGWEKVGKAAQELKRSKSTIIRLVDAAEVEFGGQLVRRSPGGHRLVNLKLLRRLI